MSDSTYTVLFVLHIVALTAAFGPVIIYALLLRRATQTAGAGGIALIETATVVNKRVTLPSLLVTIVAGFGLIAVSDGYAFEQSWVSASMTIALVLVALHYFVLSPGLSRLAGAIGTTEGSGTTGDDFKSASTTVRIATVLYQIGFVVIVWLMIAKPGIG